MSEEYSEVLRIDQLDSQVLDKEFYSTIQRLIQECFQYFVRNPWDYLGPELEGILRLIVWKYSVYRQCRTVGQEALGIQYSYQPPLLPSLLTMVGLPYLLQRQTQVCSLLQRLLPCAGNLYPRIVDCFRLLMSVSKILNSLVFLQSGLYPSVTTRFLGLRSVTTSPQQRVISYSYMSRELLWNSFIELLIFLVPLLNTSSLKAKLQKYFSLRAPSSSWCDSKMCPSCLCPPVLPCLTSCGHSLCYYCLTTNLQTQPRLPCPACGEIITEDSVQYLT